MNFIKSGLIVAVIAAVFTVRADYFLYWNTDSYSGNGSLTEGTDYAELYATTSSSDVGTQVGTDKYYFFGSLLDETSINGETNVSGYSNDTLFYVDIFSGGSRVFHGLTEGSLASYASLVSAGSIVNSLGSEQPQRWDAAAIPEPTGGMLVLVGLALLGLRRKRQ